MTSVDRFLKTDLRQEMHMQSVNDEMLKHIINILACFSYVWLQDFQRLY